jgi:hypothetical protein
MQHAENLIKIKNKLKKQRSKYVEAETYAT